MAKFRFHKLAAVVVLVGFAAWMGTGKFSSVGSAAAESDKAVHGGAAGGEEGRAAKGSACARWP